LQGYGIIYLGLSPEVTDIRRCTGITIIVALEAFVGMLFASFCCAILFIKVSRVQSIAQVAFSKPIVVRFGNGVNNHDDEPMSDDSSTFSAEETNHLPCPVLEFRIANRMHNVMDGEIVDCTVNIVASIDASQLYHSVQNPTRRRRGRKGGRREGGGPSPPANRSLLSRRNGLSFRRSALARNESPIENDVEDGTNTRKSDEWSERENPSNTSSNYSASDQKSQETTAEEDHNGVARRVFSKLVVEPYEHPFFNRIWTIRHTLNEESPLLKRAARQLLKQNNGFWPKELNNAEAVRKSFHFDSFLVSFAGTSNADCNSVYAQHVYDFDDIFIGWSFCNMLYRDEDNEDCICVDMSLLDDVIEQTGGGAEELQCFHSKRPVFDTGKAKVYANKVSHMLAL
jgi:hypothetical protein